ncbi:RING-H2 finger protein ATL63 [Gossypium australe]|uniref:RING-H2 finger protein ATL63 n=1 Tax=Gossypium australe TaxID=47621 RepID=A0A5B6WQ00_9ROSI|nr:RING-H2 finger protein ATL63 [Gossypium australe]
MTRRNPSVPLLFDSKIESTARRNQREIRQSLQYIEEEQEDDTNTTEEMADNNSLPPMIAANPVNQNPAPRTMYDYAKPNLTGAESSIVRPAIAANNFELKPNTIQMIQQFDEDPNTHLANFLEFCDTFKINGVSDNAIRLRLFPFSLRNKAKQWLNSLP